jgi:hypothetical protein
VLRLVSAFVDIAFHRRGPDTLPASSFLLGLTVAAYVFVFALTLEFAERVPLVLVAAFAINTVLSVLLTWALLRAFERERRLKQTMTALFGIDALLSALMLPILFLARSLDQSGSETIVAEVLYTIVLVWSIDVTGFVFGRAIERPYFLGLAFAIGFWLLLNALNASMFPPVTG